MDNSVSTKLGARGRPHTGQAFRHLYHSSPSRMPTYEVADIEEVLGRVLPVDVVAAWAGRRGAVLRLGTEAAP
jgi:hypothetical protein